MHELPEPLERLFELGDATIFVWEAAEGWPVRYVSPNVVQLLGLEPEALTSGRISFASLVHPDDLAPLAEAVGESVAGGLEVCAHDDYRIRSHDGGWAWVHDCTVIERDASGAVTSFVGYLLDVTAKKAADAALAEQRDRLDLVLCGTRLGLWDWNPQTNAVVFDERWAGMLGYELHEIDATLEAWRSRVHPDDLERRCRAIEAHLAGETEFYENVHRVRHRDGHWVHILDRGRVCGRDAEGRPIRFTGTQTDITAQRVAEIAAVEASHAKTAFLARMSHEIRTPLNGILGVVHLLAGMDLDAEQAALVQVLRQSGESLLTITDDVLDISKVESGELTLEATAFDVRQLIGSTHELYRERAVAKGLEYSLSVSAQTPEHAVGDPHRTRQILANLLSNATKFAETGGVDLRVDARPLEDGRVELEIRVRDTGPGIGDPEAVWLPFRQADCSTSREHGGTGLGLTICRELTMLMGGDISVRSEVGVGSEFIVRLPLSHASTDIGTPRPSVWPGALSLPVLEVLVAEDNAVNQLVVSGVLRRLGQTVTVVGDGQAAWRACEARAYDLVLMDIHMPTMDGMEACRRIRASLSEDAPRIVALSADAFAPDRAAFARARFDGIIAKPFRPSDIADLIYRVARRAA